MHMHTAFRRPSAAALLLLAMLSSCGSGGNLSAASTSGTSSPPSNPVLANNASGFVCAAGAITCVQVISTANVTQATAPVTFGQPFKAGDLAGTDTLTAQDGSGNRLPVQLDEVARRDDGSVRFGVVSVQVGGLQADERRVVNLFKSTTPSPATPAPAAQPHPLRLTANVYTQQTTLLTFGNRNGHNPGTPFLVGESITLTLGSSSHTESHTLVIDGTTAGGGFPTLTKIAEAFQQRINSQSTTYKAQKFGEGGGYEKLWLTPQNPAGGAFSVTLGYSGAASLRQQTLGEYAAPQQLVANPGPQLQQHIGKGQQLRLRGPVAHEYTVVTPFVDAATGTPHPQLTARLHTRLLDGGQRLRTDVVIENNWAYNPNPGNLTYDLAITANGQTVLTQPPLTHNHHARWHKVVWYGPEVQAQVRHHMPYFLSTQVVWNYNLGLTVPTSVLAQEATRLASANTGPMGGAFITPYFGTTGGRAEIGPYPRWTALFLVTQDDRARASMLANANAAGSIPIHYRDASTDQPLDLDRHPCVAVNFGQSCPADALPAKRNSSTIWTPDSAHQGSFSFVPYLVTGDAYYLDETLFWAAWNLTAIDPNNRGQKQGLLYRDQLRGTAWALRSVGEAARAAPDSHPMKGYFHGRLLNNLSWYANKYPNNPNPDNVSPLGMIEKPDARGYATPWQNDFMAIVLAQLAQDGYPQARPMLEWIARFTVGRFLHEVDADYCLTKAPAASLRIRTSDDQLIGDWRALFQRNWPNVTCTENLPVDPASYPDSAIGYAANARAMLGAAHNAGIAQAQGAYNLWIRKTPKIDGGFNSDPTWAIVPAP